AHRERREMREGDGYRVALASFASVNAKRIGTSTQLSIALPALCAGTKRQRRRTVSIAASSSTSKPDDSAISARCTIPSIPTSTRIVTVPCCARRRAIAGYVGGGFFP